MRFKLLLLVLIFPSFVWAQTDEENTILGVEPSAEEQAPDDDMDRSMPRNVEQTPESDEELGMSVPFKDVAVIQRRFLPKTSRFELYPNMGLVVNNSFFWNTILSARFGYNFSEQWGIEGTFAFISSTARKVTDDLEDNLNVEIADIVIPEGYYGADIKWSPLYGKLGLSGNTIVPFDMYFSLGGGLTQTNQETAPFSIHAGTGQIFAISKAFAFRWDLSFYHYSTDTRGGTISGSFTDLYLSMGVSLFFPKATYR